jgi:hypothetical protein
MYFKNSSVRQVVYLKEEFFATRGMDGSGIAT